MIERYMSEKYEPKDIEAKWQNTWDTEGIYKVSDDASKKKHYILDMFPYPSGEGLHVGHPRGYIATDVYSRFKRMHGYNVLHPMGWDAFGLPAENFAIKNKVHPREAVDRNVARFKEQLSIIGPDYDWSHEINTTDPEFYKWTQWMFLKMYEQGLAYESYEPINWCPDCQTGLANEDLEADGTCERCGSVVDKKPMRQWVLRITDYADRLLADLDTLPKWPEGVKEAQRNWIGRSEGSEITFTLNTGDHVKIFTTRADTLFGATYVVLAPEHDLVKKLSIENRSEVDAYITEVSQKSEIERTTEGKEKTGVKLEGVTVINPVNGEELPLYIADYVLAHYGTGAVMAVPAHDERDFEFAKKFDLPIKTVVVPSIEDKDNPHVDGWEVKERNNVHAVVYDPRKDAYLTLTWHDYDWQTIVLGGIDEGEDIIECAKREIAEETGYTNVEFKKHLGAPIQTLYAAPHKKVNRLAWSTGLYFELIDDTQIEVSREEHEKFDVTWMPAQDFIPENITNVELPFWQERIRGEEKAWTQLGVLIESGEFNGMTSVEAKQKITEFVGGEMKSTYRLNDWVFSRQRYWGEPIPIIHCAKCGAVPVPYEQLPVVLPDVDSYEPTGTGESPLADIEDWVNVDCPTCGEHAKRETNTMPQWAGSSWYYLRYVDPQNGEVAIDSDKEKHWLPVDVYVGGDHATRHLIYARFWHKFLHDINVVSDLEPFPRLEFLGFIQAEDGRKMSKRWGNIVNPDEMVDRFGADAFRLYEMFIGPFENTVPWSTDGLVGTRRFVEKVWRQQYKLHDNINDSLEISLHKTIKKVTTDIEGFKFNTAVSQMMILVNEMDKAELIGKEQYAIFLRLLAPFMPHATEEIWRTTLGNAGSIHVADWPKYDESKTVESEIKMVVQVNGKVRATIMVASDISEADAVALARGDVNVQKHISGEPKKTIFVPGKLISFVV